MKYIKLFFLFSVIFNFSCNNNPKEKKSFTAIDLQLNLKTGNKYWYENTIKQELNMLNISLEQEMTVAMQWEVLPKQDSNEVLEMSFEQIKIKSKAPDKTIQYDSENNKGNSFLSDLGELKNHKLKVSLSPKGKIQNIEGLQQISQSFQNELKAFLTDSAIFSAIQSAFSGYPESNVKVNDEWKSEEVLPVNNFFMTFQHVYKLENLFPKHSTISEVTQIFTDKGISRNINADISGKMQGTKSYDNATGMLLNAEAWQEMSGTYKENGVDIPITINQKETTKCTLLNP